MGDREGAEEGTGPPRRLKLDAGCGGEDGSHERVVVLVDVRSERTGGEAHGESATCRLSRSHVPWSSVIAAGQGPRLEDGSVGCVERVVCLVEFGPGLDLLRLGPHRQGGQVASRERRERGLHVGLDTGDDHADRAELLVGVCTARLADCREGWYPCGPQRREPFHAYGAVLNEPADAALEVVGHVVGPRRELRRGCVDPFVCRARCRLTSRRDRWRRHERRCQVFTFAPVAHRSGQLRRLPSGLDVDPMQGAHRGRVASR